MIGHRRVVVTGMGAVAPNGVGVDAFWKGLVDGRDATCDLADVDLRGIVRMDLSQYDRQRAGIAVDFDPLKWLAPEVASNTGRALQLLAGAGRMALADSGIGAPEGILLSVGFAAGPIAELEKINDQWNAGGPEAIDPATVWRHSPSSFVPRLGSLLGLQQPRVACFANACVSSAISLANAAAMISQGRAEVALAGGGDAFTRMGFSGFVLLGAVASQACRPFDKNRNGMIYSEGAGLLVLEELESARRRGAKIYAELKGFGLSCDADHVVAPHGSGLVLAMRQALAMAEQGIDAIDYVGAHGTATTANDRVESKALLEVFGARAGEVPVSSIKSMIGHTHGAANVHHAIAVMLAMRDGVVPPTIHHETPDPECPIDCVPNAARRVNVRTAMINAAGFGGSNASLIFQRM